MAVNSVPIPNSSSADIFRAIFGDIQADNSKNSIFSDDNPFRRKPGKELGVGVVDVEKSQSNGKVVELKKGKRKKDKNPVVDLGLIGEAQETHLETKKLKKETVTRVDLGNDLDEGKTRTSGEGKDVSLLIERGDDDGDKEEKKSKKKKRKRDELERFYEEKHYGVVEGGEERGVVVGEKRKKVDNPSDMLVSKEEEFDDEDKLLRTVFVGNLPLKVKKKSLLKEFGQFGEIDSVRIRSVPIVNTKTPRKGAIMKKQINESVDSVHAYIVFKTEESAQASLTHNMAVVGGNHIRVDRACPPRKKLKGENTPIYDNKRTIFVGNLPFDVKDEELYQLFCGIKQLESSVEAVRVIRDPNTSVGKGIAYVLFKTREAVNSVLKRRYLKLRDRELRLLHAKADSTPSKRKQLLPPKADKSPSKKLATDSRASSGFDSRTKMKSPLSYQGLRASKSGVQKKAISKTTDPTKFKPKTQKLDKVVKVCNTKRPAVAARKAKALSDASGSKQAGKKRKIESRTPESSHRNKKARRFG